jgi:hypothetical protein
MSLPHYGPDAATDKERFIWAEGQQESGGNYKAVNSSSGALGRWQIMPGNLPGWARQSGLRVVSPRYFLALPESQDKMVWKILGGYFDTYGPRGAASVWYSGQPDWHAQYGNPPVYQYVNDVMAIYKGGGGPVVNPPPLPPGPGSEDYSPVVRRSAAQFGNVANHVMDRAQVLARLRH